MPDRFRGDPRRDSKRSGFPKLDLHGKRVHEIKDLTTDFIAKHANTGGQTTLEIVHGHGTGQVKSELIRVLTELKKVGLIDNFRSPIEVASQPYILVDIY